MSLTISRMHVPLTGTQNMKYNIQTYSSNFPKLASLLQSVTMTSSSLYVTFLCTPLSLKVWSAGSKSEQDILQDLYPEETPPFELDMLQEQNVSEHVQPSENPVGQANFVPLRPRPPVRL